MHNSGPATLVSLFNVAGPTHIFMHLLNLTITRGVVPLTSTRFTQLDLGYVFVSR